MADSNSLVQHVESRPIVIAHRGASGYLPEHTLEAYELAVTMGADFIEPDLVVTKDGHLIARHENRLDSTTDVSERPDLAHLKTTKSVDGRQVEGWFSEDLTLAQIKTLKARERLPSLRKQGAEHDGKFEVPTLAEILTKVAHWQSEYDREIGIYPETKHPTHFKRLGLAMEATLVEQLHEAGYQGPDAKVFIQSFEIGNLEELDSMTDIKLIQLLLDQGGPRDRIERGEDLSYAAMATEAGLRQIARYADGIGPEKSMILPRDESGALDVSLATSLVKHAHAVGLAVHPYTFRAENYFVPSNFQSDGDAAALGDLVGELAVFISLGIDGFFTDHSDLGVRARDTAK